MGIISHRSSSFYFPFLCLGLRSPLQQSGTYALLLGAQSPGSTAVTRRWLTGQEYSWHLFGNLCSGPP